MLTSVMKYGHFWLRLAWFVAIAGGASSAVGAASGGEYVCLGPQHAKVQLVFLHGWDNPHAQPAAWQYRAMMTTLADQQGWRVAMPRGGNRCDKGRRQCWWTHSQADVEHSWAVVKTAMAHCFDATKPYGIVGYSNGGYLTSALFASDPQPAPAWLIMFGAAENGRYRHGASHGGAPLTIAVGRKDSEVFRAKSYYNKLKQGGAPVDFVMFSGGHIVSREVLTRTVNRYSEKTKISRQTRDRSLLAEEDI